MIGRSFHRHLPHPHHLLRILLIVMLALLAYLLVTETAAADAGCGSLPATESAWQTGAETGRVETEADRTEAACRA